MFFWSGKGRKNGLFYNKFKTYYKICIELKIGVLVVRNNPQGGISQIFDILRLSVNILQNMQVMRLWRANLIHTRESLWIYQWLPSTDAPNAPTSGKTDKYPHPTILSSLIRPTAKKQTLISYEKGPFPNVLTGRRKTTWTLWSTRLKHRCYTVVGGHKGRFFKF